MLTEQETMKSLAEFFFVIGAPTMTTIALVVITGSEWAAGIWFPMFVLMGIFVDQLKK